MRWGSRGCAAGTRPRGLGEAWGGGVASGTAGGPNRVGGAPLCLAIGGSSGAERRINVPGRSRRGGGGGPLAGAAY